MINAAKIVQVLQNQSSRLDKELTIYNAWTLLDDRVFFEGMAYASDPLISFGVKNSIPAGDPTATQEATWDETKTLLEQLSKRELTGNSALAAIDQLRLRCDATTWDFFVRRILIKNMRCGATGTTVNTVLKNLSKTDPTALKYIIPVFTCQLAHDAAKHPTKITGKKLIDFKLDGVRLLTICHVETQQVFQCTRNGAPNKNFTTIKEEFAQKVLPNLTKSMVFDGEVVSENFQKLMTQTNRKNNVDTSDARLALFDIIPMKEFNMGEYNVSAAERDKQLHNIIDTANMDLVFVLDKELVDLSTKIGHNRYLEINKTALDEGYEGIMLKDPDAGYVCKRSHGYLKQKPFIEVDLEVKHYNKANEGKYMHMFGSLHCEGTEDGKFIAVDVSGFSDSVRADIWNNMNNVIGQIVTIRADAITKSENKDSYSLRFPRFVSFRSVNGEKHVKD